jgi:hypothetical protein
MPWAVQRYAVAKVGLSRYLRLFVELPSAPISGSGSGCGFPFRHGLQTMNVGSKGGAL